MEAAAAALVAQVKQVDWHAPRSWISRSISSLFSLDGGWERLERQQITDFVKMIQDPQRIDFTNGRWLGRNSTHPKEP